VRRFAEDAGAAAADEADAKGTSQAAHRSDAIIVRD